MTDHFTMRAMRRDEVATLVGWAEREGWNPGLHDGELFWQSDPRAFVAVEHDGELVGGITTASYGGAYGFIGFFIMRPEFRGRGWGDAVWHAQCNALAARLDEGAAIGIDGVFAMQPYYATTGFAFSHRDLRFEAQVPADAPANGSQSQSDPAIVPLADVPFADVAAYDRHCFPAARDRFLQGWIAQDDALALGYRKDGVLKGYGVIRRCVNGCKIGPLLADDGDVAEALYAALSTFAAGGPLYLDVPENNPQAMALAARHDMVEVFGCARMYRGPAPVVDADRVFGVTTFEFG